MVTYHSLTFKSRKGRVAAIKKLRTRGFHSFKKYYNEYGHALSFRRL